eukprot:3069409-Alexandrium_andersonii.AAC.1
MSASLVGSEMCIRDSPSASPRSSSRAPSPPARPSAWRCAPQPAGPSWPVSYTHLTLPTICSV